MSLYCPDCGAQCEADAEYCPECNFPMALKVTASTDMVTIEGREVAKWKRLSALLRRNGMRVTTRQTSSWTTSAAWWTLPSLGVLILLASIFVGGPIIDLLWPVDPSASIPIVDLNTPRETGSPERAGSPETDSAGESGDGAEDFEDSVSSLARALETSEEQRSLTNEQNLDLDQFIDRVAVDREVVIEHARQALLRLEVDDIRARATLLDERGFFLMESSLNNDAFRRESRTVSRRGVLQDQLVYIVPKVAPLGRELAEARRIRTSPDLVLELMRADLEVDIGFEFEYDRQLDLGDVLWVAVIRSRDIDLERVEIIGKDSSGDIDHWFVDGEFGRRDSGNPVFDITGKLTAVLVPFTSRPSVVSLRTIRERAPLIYKDLQ